MVCGALRNNLQEQYENRRRERAIGLAMYGSLIEIQNLITGMQLYSWPPGEDVKVMNLILRAKEIQTKLRDVEAKLLSIDTVFYAPIIPTEAEHKLTDKNSVE